MKIEEVTTEYEMKNIINKVNENIIATQVGMENIYREFKKVKDEIEQEKDNLSNERRNIENKVMNLLIQSYPMNTRINIEIETNFGSIDYKMDYPPVLESRIGETIQNIFDSLLNKLYESHEARGGKFMGNEGFKEFIDEKGKTIIHEEPLLRGKS